MLAKPRANLQSRTGRARASAGPAAGKKNPFARAGTPGWREEALWSIWPDPEQIKVNGKVAAGPAPAPAGRELHKRMGLGMVLGLSWAKHVAAAVRSRSRRYRCRQRCLRGGLGGGEKAELLKNTRGAGVRLFFGEEHPCFSSPGFIPLVSLPQSLLPLGDPAWRSRRRRRGHEDSIPLSAGR